MRNTFFFLFLLCLLGCKSNPEPIVLAHTSNDLDAWQVTVPSLNDSGLVKVPGSLQTDFLKLGWDFPTDSLQHLQLDWSSLEELDCVYSTSFRMKTDYDNSVLVFDGIDTYAYIVVDDSLLLETNNMFRSWSIDVSYLDPTVEHKVELYFDGSVPVKTSLLMKDSLYGLTAGNDTHPTNKMAPYVRKAQYQFGWDWAQRMVTTGIWKPVRLEQWNTARIVSVWREKEQISSQNADFEWCVAVKSYPGATYSIAMEDAHSIPAIEHTQFYEVDTIRIPVSISNPKLWNPIGYGGPNLYTAHINIEKNGVLLQSEKQRYGLRTIELIQDQDSIGESYYWKINGQPFFAKGANAIPPSLFVHDNDSSDVEQLIAAALDANMNTIRVWGGGVYGSDYFYELCDAYGIVVWQDFMFACAMYPASEGFLENVTTEAEEQVQRLRNHPSLGLWCGNNEVDVAWKNWGWQKAFNISATDSIKMLSEYDKLFKDVLPNAVAAHHATMNYVHTSPLSNWGKAENFNTSSMHYWGVWHGEDPFTSFRDNVPRFMAEYGFQSWPSSNTVATFAPIQQKLVWNDVLESRQKSYKTNALISTHVKQHYKEPTQMVEWLYVNQLTQARALEMAIDAHRGKMGHCMGTLYWQLNDCWAAPTWSTMDVHYQYKAAHFTVKRMYAPVLLQMDAATNEIKVISDQQEPVHGELHLTWYMADGRVETTVLDSAIHLNQLEIVVSNIDPSWQNQYKNALWQLELKQSHKVTAERLFYVQAPSQLNLPEPEVNIELEPNGKTCLVHISSASPLQSVWLETSIDPRKIRVDFSDNNFHLVPDLKKTITLSASETIDWQAFCKVYTIGNKGRAIALY